MGEYGEKEKPAWKSRYADIRIRISNCGGGVVYNTAIVQIGSENTLSICSLTPHHRRRSAAKNLFFLHILLLDDLTSMHDLLFNSHLLSVWCVFFSVFGLHAATTDSGTLPIALNGLCSAHREAEPHRPKSKLFRHTRRYYLCYPSVPPSFVHNSSNNNIISTCANVETLVAITRTLQAANVGQSI